MGEKVPTARTTPGWLVLTPLPGMSQWPSPSIGPADLSSFVQSHWLKLLHPANRSALQLQPCQQWKTQAPSQIAN